MEPEAAVIDAFTRDRLYQSAKQAAAVPGSEPAIPGAAAGKQERHRRGGAVPGGAPSRGRRDAPAGRPFARIAVV